VRAQTSRGILHEIQRRERRHAAGDIVGLIDEERDKRVEQRVARPVDAVKVGGLGVWDSQDGFLNRE
jgi:hypothetical protein